jgi:hypothetical protein
MKKLIAGGLVTFMLAAAVHAAGSPPPAEPRRDILGVKVGMTEQEAHAVLQKIGRLPNPRDRKRTEVWEVNDPYFSHLAVQFEKKTNLVHFVTAFAHGSKKADRRRMRYDDVGELKKARRQIVEPHPRNNYKYEWLLGAAGRNPKINVVAWGRDRDHLDIYSIERVN